MAMLAVVMEQKRVKRALGIMPVGSKLRVDRNTYAMPHAVQRPRAGSAFEQAGGGGGLGSSVVVQQPSGGSLFHIVECSMFPSNIPGSSQLAQGGKS